MISFPWHSEMLQERATLLQIDRLTYWRGVLRFQRLYQDLGMTALLAPLLVEIHCLWPLPVNVDFF
jgi:hypothetical protein